METPQLTAPSLIHCMIELVVPTSQIIWIVDNFIIPPHTRTHIHTHTHTYVYICIYIHTNTHTHRHTHTHTVMHMHIRTHPFLHSHTHTEKQLVLLLVAFTCLRNFQIRSDLNWSVKWKEIFCGSLFIIKVWRWSSNLTGRSQTFFCERRGV